MIVAGLDVETLYRNYGHSVLRRARQILGNEDEAADVLQELFTGLVARPHQFDGRSSPSTFLYAATTHACLSRLRDQRNRRRLLDEQVRPWLTDVDRRAVDAASQVREVLAQLTDDEARAVVYVHLDGMTHAEVAESLGCSRRRVGDLLERVSRRVVRQVPAAVGWLRATPIRSDHPGIILGHVSRSEPRDSLHGRRDGPAGPPARGAGTSKARSGKNPPGAIRRMRSLERRL